MSAIVVVALILATTALMLVTLNTKAAAVADLHVTAAHHVEAQIGIGTVMAAAPDRR